MKTSTQNTKNGELVRHWLASGVLDNGGAMHRDGLAMKLYCMCLDIIQGICQQRSSIRGPTELLREELGKLYLWGESFGPGQLDKALNHAEDLRTVVIKALQQIGKLLLYRVKTQQTRSDGSNDLQSQVQNLTTFIDQARTMMCQMGDESSRENDCSDSEPSSDEEDVLESDGLEGLARSIRIQTSHLVRVGPTIQKVLMCAEKAEAQSSFPPVMPFKVSGPANFYVSSIRDKFKSAQDSLIARLGEANWQRHHHVRKDEQIEYAENSTAFFRPYSAFHEHGVHTSMPDETGYAASHASFSSGKSETKLGGLKVPQCPQQIIEGKPFQCFLCGQTQLEIRNRVDWKMHVFADLKPYICTFPDCKVELAQFSTRTAWAHHEFSHHRTTCSWRCAECSNEYPTRLLYSDHLRETHQRKYSDISLQTAVDVALDRRENPAEKEECPLCRLVPGCSKPAFVKHVGRHMEQIALMALPRDTEVSEINDSGTTDESRGGRLSIASRGNGRESKLDVSHSDDVGKNLSNQLNSNLATSTRQWSHSRMPAESSQQSQRQHQVSSSYGQDRMESRAQSLPNRPPPSTPRTQQAVQEANNGYNVAWGRQQLHSSTSNKEPTDLPPRSNASRLPDLPPPSSSRNKQVLQEANQRYDRLDRDYSDTTAGQNTCRASANSCYNLNQRDRRSDRIDSSSTAGRDTGRNSANSCYNSNQLDRRSDRDYNDTTSRASAQPTQASSRATSSQQPQQHYQANSSDSQILAATRTQFLENLNLDRARFLENLNLDSTTAGRNSGRASAQTELTSSSIAWAQQQQQQKQQQQQQQPQASSGYSQERLAARAQFLQDLNLDRMIAGQNIGRNSANPYYNSNQRDRGSDRKR